MDDWDAVSNEMPPDGATDTWDAVSTQQPSQGYSSQQPATPELSPNAPRRRRSLPDNLVIADTSEPDNSSDQGISTIQSLPALSPQDNRATSLSQTDLVTPALSRSRRTSVPALPVKRTALIIVSIAVAVVLVISGFKIFQVVGIHNANVAATTTAETTVTHIHATATAQVVAPATTSQQIYNQATSRTPVVDDPLSDGRNSWGVFTTNWGGQCAFTGGAYHLSLSKPGYWLVCTGGSMGVLKSSVNFALQVQISIVQGNYGGIIFGADATPGGASNAYRIDINPVGAYVLYRIQNKQSLALQQGLDPAIKTGLNQSNVVTIIVNNSNFYLYVNRQFMMSKKLTAYSPGESDFEALSPDQPTDVAFSNLKIWGL